MGVERKERGMGEKDRRQREGERVTGREGREREMEREEGREGKERMGVGMSEWRKKNEGRKKPGKRRRRVKPRS